MPSFLADYGPSLLANNYAAFPVKQRGKYPIVEGWRTAKREQLKQWIGKYPKASVGVRTGGVVAFDIDCEDAPFVAGFIAWCRAEFGPAPLRYGRRPKAMLIYRPPELFRKIQSNEWRDTRGRKAQFEGLGDGQQFVAYGIHEDTGEPYQWPDGDLRSIHRDKLTVVTEDDVRRAAAEFDRRAEAAGFTRVSTTESTVADSDEDDIFDIRQDRVENISNEDFIARVDELPNDDAEYEGPGFTWFNVLASINHQLGQDGEEAARRWAQKSGKYNEDPGRFDKTWRSLGKRDNLHITGRFILKWHKKLVAARKSEVGKIDLINGAGIKPERVEWHWEGYLARGKFHLLGGPKTAGKSTIAYDITAILTKRGKWPDGTPAPIGDVLIWSSEDDIADTIIPRILAAGGDPNRVYFCGPVTTKDGKKRPFDPATDMPELADAAAQIPNFVFMIIDPVVMASAADSFKNAETRRGLQPVIDFAEQTRACVLGITHFTKGTQGKSPIERITGTIAYAALARIVLGAIKGIGDKLSRMVRIASNIGPSGGGFDYTTEDAPVPGAGFTARVIKWGDYIPGEASTLIDAVESPESQKLKATTWLTDLIDGAGKDGVDVSDVKKAAEAHGFSWRTVERAKAELGDGIEAKQRKGTAHGGWYWVAIDKTHGFDDDL